MTVLNALWLIFPAYCANAAPVLIKGRRPLDRGRRLGRYRLLGDGKTVEGTLGGVLVGVLVGIGQMQLQPSLAGWGLTAMTVQLAVLLSTGAILGDIAGAFIKRRLGIARGRPVFPLDQLDFLVVALVFASAAVRIDLVTAAVLVIATPVLHKTTNVIAFVVKMKKAPW